MTVLDAAIAWGILGACAGSLLTMILFTILQNRLDEESRRNVKPDGTD